MKKDNKLIGIVLTVLLGSGGIVATVNKLQAKSTEVDKAIVLERTVRTRAIDKLEVRAEKVRDKIEANEKVDIRQSVLLETISEMLGEHRKALMKLHKEIDE